MICADPFCQLPNDGHRHEGLRDLAHSYADEVYQPYQWQPYRFHWTHVLKFVAGMVLAYGLFVALIVIFGG